MLVAGGNLEVACQAVAEVLEQVDRVYSRFRRDSELSRLNRRAGQTATLSPLLTLAIEAALRAARLSDGLVDPTVGRAMRLIGYDRDFDRLADLTAPLEMHLEPIPGWQAVRFEARSRTIRLPIGVELDLGSTGKALASDLAARAALRGMGGEGGAVVSLGGDIATAGAVPDGGWRVLVAEDSRADPDSDGEVIGLRGGAIATSSTSVRRWSRGEAELHHLIDPRTGLPTSGPWRTATVVAKTCVDANTAATAAIVGGESSLAWLERLGLPARLVSTSGDVRRVGDWPVPVAA